MYRDYEEYMRVVWGYNPIMQEYNRSAYINPYTSQQFNNMQFENFQLGESGKEEKSEEVNRNLNNELESCKTRPGNVNKQNMNIANNLNDIKKQPGRSYYQNQFQKGERSGPAMSYKNFLKF